MNTTLPLRLTYNNSDVVFYILNNKPWVMEDDITVSIKGETYKLYKNMGRWKAQDENAPNGNLLAAIGDSIALRYRI
ncbi:hypothetical protein BDD43_5034 [Mucilaginibacter gracilis]|uniref:Uncharacterized protein n=1 Tax=Mucilaginibacter gracilis TaxID=423350 RepID=A0A495J7R4_9SPHI|nr:hypothetical protein [Mucilaginibacter gracilis]RKR84781.1 hypothetical protein BDD43_5034 [Mucilaginibacter gracilis]